MFIKLIKKKNQKRSILVRVHRENQSFPIKNFVNNRARLVLAYRNAKKKKILSNNDFSGGGGEKMYSSGCCTAVKKKSEHRIFFMVIFL